MGARKKISAEKRKEALKTMYFAKLQNVPTSPRKMRLVADMVRGMEVNRALGVLKFSSKEASGKAGRSRWLGHRPHNRGVVMNPVDHPMGGGEGRQSGGHPRSRKGLYAKGLKTRAPKKQSSKYIIERRK